MAGPARSRVDDEDDEDEDEDEDEKEAPPLLPEEIAEAEEAGRGGRGANAPAEDIASSSWAMEDGRMMVAYYLLVRDGWAGVAWSSPIGMCDFADRKGR
jgi:hypothetical protein